jgi:uncharacterized protein YbjT (DUF2867 family)
MSSKKIILVLGATGAQGGGLARAILRDPDSEFAVRAVTRNPDSEKAKELAVLGAEVVAGDIGDEARITELLQGVYGAFFVTFYWEHQSPERERAEAAGLARAAKAASVQHVIWSTLEDSRDLVPLDDDRMPTLGGKYKVPHFDAKAEANRFFTELGVPTTFLRTGFYWENFIYFGLGPIRGEDGKLFLTLPIGTGRLASIGAEDIGKCALGVFKRGTDFINETIGIAGGHVSGEEFAAGLSQALGETVTYQPLTFGQFRDLGFPGADDLGNMFQYNIEFEAAYTGGRDLEFTRSLNPEVQTFAEWVITNKDAIPRM